MSGDNPSQEGPEGTGRPTQGNDGGPEAAGVLGNLPRSRPSVRSPRRAQAHAGAGRESEESPDAAPIDQPAGSSDSPPESRSRGREAEIEALARAGISLAGDAATLGFRVAGKAAAALRGAVERR